MDPTESLLVTHMYADDPIDLVQDSSDDDSDDANDDYKDAESDEGSGGHSVNGVRKDTSRATDTTNRDQMLRPKSVVDGAVHNILGELKDFKAQQQNQKEQPGKEKDEGNPRHSNSSEVATEVLANPIRSNGSHTTSFLFYFKEDETNTSQASRSGLLLIKATIPAML
jgi:hypothetical protein